MPVVRTVLLSSLLLALVGGLAGAQPWVADLQREDGPSLAQHLQAAGTTYQAEPLLAQYLAQGQNPDFVALLVEKGASPNQKVPGTELTPLDLVVTRNLAPRIADLLLKAGATLEAKVPGFSGTLIDVALDKREYATAAWLVKANQRRLPRERLVLREAFKDYPAFLLDDLVQVRNLLRYGDWNNDLVWDLTLGGNSRKVARYLLELQVEAHLNDPGSPDENATGLDLLASNVDLLGYLVTQGLSVGAVDFEALYQRLFAHRDLEGVKALKALDPTPRPGLYAPALAAGLGILKATSNDLQDLAKPELLRGPDGLALVQGVYEQSDFPTVLPLLQAAESDALVLGLYRYAFGKKDLALIQSLVAWEAPKIRPDLDAEAARAGIGPLKALTHDLADLKTPGLYQDPQHDGRERLVGLLLRTPQGGKTLLERIFELTDFPTVLSLIEPLAPAPELLKGKEFSAAYQDWLTRGNKDILTFGVVEPAVRGTIRGDQIALLLPEGTDPQGLVAVFTLSGGTAAVASVRQVSGTTANDFTQPVVYEITARDGTKKTYTVTVTVPVPAPVPQTPPPQSDSDRPAGPQGSS